MVTELDADDLLRTLLAHEVEFVVIGGLAVVAHGYVRGTKDLDVFVEPSPENRRRLHAALVSLDGLPADQGDFRPEEMPVPFTPEGLAEGGSYEQLVAMKRAAGRPEDETDLARLREARGEE